MKYILSLLFLLIPLTTMANNDPTVEEILAETVQKAVNFAEETGQWVLDVTPRIVEQYLMWELVSSTFFVIVGLVFMLIPVVFRYKAFTDFDWEDPDNFFPLLITSLLTAVPGILLVLFNIYSILFIKIAPEIYLIKQFLQ